MQFMIINKLHYLISFCILFFLWDRGGCIPPQILIEIILDKMASCADGNKLIDDHTLVALTIMIAEPKPDEKEMMISVIMNCICG